MTERDQGTCKISLIISTRNRAHSLRQTLESLTQSPTFVTWEALVINNGSSDDTALVLDTFADRLPLVVLEEPEAGKNRALNRAIDFARGELFIFTDDDVRLRPGWLSAHFQASLNWPEANVFGGPIHPVFPANTPEWISSPDFVLASEAFGSKPREVEGFTDESPYGANLAIRASVFQNIRFDENVGPIATRSYAQGSEYELMRRLRNQGERFIHVPDAAVDHILTPEQIEIDWLLGRAERIGRGSARIKKKRVPKSWTGWLPLYARLHKAQWKSYLSQEDNPRERFNRMQRVHYWRGYIAESRAMRSENVQPAATQGEPAAQAER